MKYETFGLIISIFFFNIYEIKCQKNIESLSINNRTTIRNYDEFQNLDQNIFNAKYNKAGKNSTALFLQNESGSRPLAERVNNSVLPSTTIKPQTHQYERYRTTTPHFLTTIPHAYKSGNIIPCNTTPHSIKNALYSHKTENRINTTQHFATTIPYNHKPGRPITTTPLFMTTLPYNQIPVKQLTDLPLYATAAQHNRNTSQVTIKPHFVTTVSYNRKPEIPITTTPNIITTLPYNRQPAKRVSSASIYGMPYNFKSNKSSMTTTPQPMTTIPYRYFKLGNK